MTLTVSVVLLAGFLLALLLKQRVLGVWAAVIATVFGFYLADTAAADTVNELVIGFAGALNSLG
ncbi:hypothetical protein [Streptomyces sp. JJ36]|uniref:hypothetical protein n=1 Tax=Streptomyces sp. JJ36 TaxID=2736645 RepID=UPI001F2BCE86|nr:hypothetical protein [Streptomyces sp. JJ36]MCF6525680.1 hypothetical protein [Streptomyces sp. JJ36]